MHKPYKQFWNSHSHLYNGNNAANFKLNRYKATSQYITTESSPPQQLYSARSGFPFFLHDCVFLSICFCLSFLCFSPLSSFPVFPSSPLFLPFSLFHYPYLSRKPLETLLNPTPMNSVLFLGIRDLIKSGSGELSARRGGGGGGSADSQAREESGLLQAVNGEAWGWGAEGLNASPSPFPKISNGAEWEGWTVKNFQKEKNAGRNRPTTRRRKDYR